LREKTKNKGVERKRDSKREEKRRNFNGGAAVNSVGGTPENDH